MEKCNIATNLLAALIPIIMKFDEISKSGEFGDGEVHWSGVN
jgi:hypothetical protein